MRLRVLSCFSSPLRSFPFGALSSQVPFPGCVLTQNEVHWIIIIEMNSIVLGFIKSLGRLGSSGDRKGKEENGRVCSKLQKLMYEKSFVCQQDYLVTGRNEK